MIRAVTIQNFKNIKDLRIELDRLTVFVGANGSGKTSVLDALNRAAHVNPLDPNWAMAQRAQFDWIYTRGSSGVLFIRCETVGGQFEIEVTPPEPLLVPTSPSRVQEWKFGFIDADGNYGKTFEAARGMVLPLVFLRLNEARLTEPSYSEHERPAIQSDGSGIASVLAFMALNDPDSFDELLTHIRDLLPQIKRIRFHKVPIHRSETELILIGNESRQRERDRVFQGEAILFDYEHAKDIAAHTVSEGTLMIVGLLTVLLGPDRPRVLLLDDIEHGLHPLAQKQLVAVIGRIMAKFPDLQILATAHSPYLLNYLSPDQVRIMTTDSEGHARCGRLTDHPKFATWKDEMAPGEMWSLFGEKWLAGTETVK
jgi:predicted ATPase